MHNLICAHRRNCIERGSSDQNLNLTISKTNEANKFFELLALLPPRFDKNRARYDFLKFTYQMKIARFNSESTPKNTILVLIGEESTLELQMEVEDNFNTKFMFVCLKIILSMFVCLKIIHRHVQLFQLSYMHMQGYAKMQFMSKCVYVNYVQCTSVSKTRCLNSYISTQFHKQSKPLIT